MPKTRPRRIPLIWRRPIGTATCFGGVSSIMVADLIVHARSRDIFVLTVNGGSVNNAQIHRIGCDGVADGTSALFTIYNTSGQGRDADLEIDQINNWGYPMPEGEVQLMAGGLVNAGAGPDWFQFNTDLTMTGSLNVGDDFTMDSRSRIAVSVANRMLNENGRGLGIAFFDTPPPGWN